MSSSEIKKSDKDDIEFCENKYLSYMNLFCAFGKKEKLYSVGIISDEIIQFLIIAYLFQ